MQVPPYGWDDVAEPTDDELAEVDAALAAVGPSSVSEGSMREWGQNAKVKLAIRAVGLPDSQPDWLERFSRALFAITEASEALGVDALLQAQSQYQQFGSAWSWEHNTVIHKFLGIGLDPERAAMALGITVHEVCTRLSPTHGLKLLEADRMLRAGQAVRLVARRTGIPQGRLMDWTRLCKIKTARQAKYSIASAECKARAVEMGRAGVKTTAVVAALQDEFPLEADHLSWHVVHKWIKRAAA